MRGAISRNLAIFALTVVAAGVLIDTSQKVQQAERDLGQVQDQIEGERERIRVLQAEWAYLNNPERLEKLADKYLDLVPPGHQDLVGKLSFPDISNSVSGQELSDAAPHLLPVPSIKPAPPQRPIPGVSLVSTHSAPPASPATSSPAKSSEKENRFNDLLSRLNNASSKEGGAR